MRTSNTQRDIKSCHDGEQDSASLRPNHSEQLEVMDDYFDKDEQTRKNLATCDLPGPREILVSDLIQK